MRDLLVGVFVAVAAATGAGDGDGHASVHRFNVEFVFGAAAALNFDFHKMHRGFG